MDGCAELAFADQDTVVVDVDVDASLRCCGVGLAALSKVSLKSHFEAN